MMKIVAVFVAMFEDANGFVVGMRRDERDVDGKLGVEEKRDATGFRCTGLNSRHF